MYDQADIERYFSHLERGVLPKHNQHALVVLGRYHEAQQSSPWDLRTLHLERFIEENVRCAVCAFGTREQDCLTHALLLGLDVRVGFENNHLSSDGQLAKSNAEQIQRLKDVSELLGVPLHDAESFRESI